MTKMKNPTRRALMLSVMALVLCFTMLVGTTYAWFTDSVTSGKNKIVAGNLDIELYHTSGAKTVTETDDNIGIPSTVTTIGKEAFQLSGVIALTIPDNVTTIEEGAFRDMPNLEDLYIVGNPTIANFAARNCKNLIKVTLERQKHKESIACQRTLHAAVHINARWNHLCMVYRFRDERKKQDHCRKP